MDMKKEYQNPTMLTIEMVVQPLLSDSETLGVNHTEYGSTGDKFRSREDDFDDEY